MYTPLRSDIRMFTDEFVLGADFNLMHSRFKDLNDPRLVDKAQAAVIFLRDYLKQLASLGHHVLSTIPVCRMSSDMHLSNITSVTFRVNSEQRPGAEQSPVSEPAILILCMNGNRPLPSPVPQHWGRWIANGLSPSCGTLVLSGDSFLRGRLLPSLSEVNAVTRVEPTFSEFHKMTWRLHLTTWAKNPEHVPGDCAFVSCPHAEADGVSRYRWKFGRKFSTDCADAHTVCCKSCDTIPKRVLTTSAQAALRTTSNSLRPPAGAWR